jgi:sulfur-carrier protein adenylyltransferase/sulfurtransferase
MLQSIQEDILLGASTMKWKQFLTPAKNLDADETRSYMKTHQEGSYTLLDVRQPGEYEQERIPGAKLVPLPELPGRVSELDTEKPLITYCAIGGRSRAAAQYLSGRGFQEVYNLKGVLAAWQGGKASGPADMGMAYVTGNETLKEVVVLAYGMEHGLAEFYRSSGSKTKDKETRDVLLKLAGVEEEHQEKLYQIHLTLDPSADREKLENQVVPGVMEGGFTTDEFLEQHRSMLDTPTHVLSLAMMLETQAFDLYMRYAQKAKDQETRKALQNIGEEEKAHIAALGRLMDATIH